jgi:hypothetical protein
MYTFLKVPIYGMSYEKQELYAEPHHFSFPEPGLGPTQSDTAPQYWILQKTTAFFFLAK